jgi:hypothetical protein
LAEEVVSKPITPHIDFDAPAVLRKWPSIRNERRTEGTSPYLLLDGTLEECIGVLMINLLPCATCTRYTPRLSRR